MRVAYLTELVCIEA